MFYGSNSLETVYLSDAVETIWPEEFSSCDNLKNVRLSNNLEPVDTNEKM